MIIQNRLKKFSVIPKELIMDNTISDRARFMFCWMASMPDDWDFYMGSMSKALGYSEDTVRKYIKELCDSGWLVKGEQTTRGDGRYGAVAYTINEQKFPKTEITVSEKFRDGKTPTQTKYLHKTNTDSILNNYNKKKESVEKEINFSENEGGGTAVGDARPKSVSKEKESSAKERESLSFVREDMLDMFKEFLAYRREIGHSLKPVSYERAYKQLLELSNGDSLLARKIIDQSIANGWRGLFKLKANDTTRTNERTETNLRLFVTPRDNDEPEHDDLPF